MSDSLPKPPLPDLSVNPFVDLLDRMAKHEPWRAGEVQIPIVYGSPKSNKALELGEKIHRDVFGKELAGNFECNHKFKLYIGLKDCFEYCVHCDKKQRLD